MKKNICLMAALGFTLLVVSEGCRPQEEEIKRETKIPVRLAPVERKELARTIHTYGRASSKKEMKLSFKINGIIQKILVDEGQSVRSGQLLARLDLSEIESQVRQARSAFEKAQRDRKRVENLYNEKAATLEQFQDTQTAFQVAESRLKAAEFNLRHSTIHAPAKGKILKRFVEENEIVGAGMPVLFFASLEKDWIVRVGVSDRDLVRLRLKDPAAVTFDAYPGEEFDAFVSEIVESADPMTGTYEVELRISSGEKRLASGFVARVDIFPTEKKLYSVIPVDALVEAEEGRGFVFTVDRETLTARRIPITTGFLFADKIAVESGLEEAREVVTEGALYLREGKGVLILKEQRPW